MDMRHNAPFSKIEPAGRRGQWRRGFLLAAVAVLALAASLVMTPAPAEAQSNVTLVSNLATSLGGTTNVLAGGSHPRYASTFTTGPAGGGYGLALVKVYMGIGSSGSRTPDVAIHSDSNGVPGQRLFALDPPDALAGTPDFAPFGAPPGTRLAANTTYWVVVGTSSGDVRLVLTDADGELPGKQPGWSIGNNLVSMSGPDASWVTDPRSVRMAVEGVVFDTFVSSLGRGGSINALTVSSALTRSGSFNTGTDDSGYGLTSVTLRLRKQSFSGNDPVARVSIHSDRNGAPGTMLFKLVTMPTVSTQTPTNYTFAAPPEVRLPPNTTFWVSVSSDGPGLIVRSTRDTNEDGGKQPGWSIGNASVTRGVSSSFIFKMSVRGVVFEEAIVRTQNELAWDLPLSDDTWGYVDTSGPSSGTLNDPLDDLRSNGDRWRLHVDSSRRYRVEVNFGSATPQEGYDEGGGIDVWDFKPRGDLWDHRSDDGRAYIEFHTSPRTPYYLLVRARSFGEHQTWEYFGDYTITLTDISHIYQMVSNGGAAAGTSKQIVHLDKHTARRRWFLWWNGAGRQRLGGHVVHHRSSLGGLPVRVHDSRPVACYRDRYGLCQGGPIRGQQRRAGHEALRFRTDWPDYKRIQRPARGQVLGPRKRREPGGQQRLLGSVRERVNREGISRPKNLLWHGQPRSGRRLVHRRQYLQP